MKSKAELRAEMRRKRREMPPERRKSVSEAICHKLLARADIGSAITSGAVIAVYLATDEEVDLGVFIEGALRRGARLAAPRWNGIEYELSAFKTMAELEKGAHSILEPKAGATLSDAAIWLVPGLAFTRAGARLGYGGGWYDRMLRNSTQGKIRLGIAFDFQIIDSLMVESHDINLTEIVNLVGS